MSAEDNQLSCELSEPNQRNIELSYVIDMLQKNLNEASQPIGASELLEALKNKLGKAVEHRVEVVTMATNSNARPDMTLTVSRRMFSMPSTILLQWSVGVMEYTRSPLYCNGVLE